MQSDSCLQVSFFCQKRFLITVITLLKKKTLERLFFLRITIPCFLQLIQHFRVTAYQISHFVLTNCLRQIFFHLHFTLRKQITGRKKDRARIQIFVIPHSILLLLTQKKKGLGERVLAEKSQQRSVFPKCGYATDTNV